MTKITALSGLQPTPKYNAKGYPVGLSFVCPDCPPHTCLVTKVWGPRPQKLGEHLKTLEALTVDDVPAGDRAGCQFKGKIQAGAVFWWE